MEMNRRKFFGVMGAMLGSTVLPLPKAQATPIAEAVAEATCACGRCHLRPMYMGDLMEERYAQALEDILREEDRLWMELAIAGGLNSKPTASINSALWDINKADIKKYKVFIDYKDIEPRNFV